MASFSTFVSREEFNLFHKIDRDLYTILVTNLSRDPVEAMQILALWLWLERSGFSNVVKKILSLPYILVNEVADEAVTCLNSINNDQISSPSENNEIPLLQSLMRKEFTLQLLFENRLKAIEGVKKIMNEVCIRVVSDIMQQAILRNSGQQMVGMSISQNQWLGQNSGVGLGGGVDQNQPLTPEIDVPADDRTMFVTFSKGYPVYEWEVKEFLIRNYGDCVESLYMQEVQPNEQSLFARIVFHKASIIDGILRGRGKVKFTINGKHVWARKFVPKRAKS
ncbi:Rho guanine nucleotide exchange factor [Quillaja saponaria]|uniref:Rho guanine nucleotide exchange factor n=1 Tax=Quillaja saponaria TaxID=32244 RepID=A0AAD7LD85_QUISA|nr:Rho guanine nucleotide exchange factor [Quillaja saponaria]